MQSKRGSNSAILLYHIQTIEGSREQCNSCNGEEFKLSYILYYMHERLNGYGKS